MTIAIEDFLEKMLKFFPLKNTEYNNKKQEIEEMCKLASFKKEEDYFEGCGIIIVEDIFMPEVIKLLEKNSDVEALKKIFDYFEQVVNEGDKCLFNVFSITVLEMLGNDAQVLNKAKQYMGPKTRKYQLEADKNWVDMFK